LPTDARRSDHSVTHHSRALQRSTQRAAAAAYYAYKVYKAFTNGEDACLGRAVFSPLGGNVATLYRGADWSNGWIDVRAAWW